MGPDLSSLHQTTPTKAECAWAWISRGVCKGNSACHKETLSTTRGKELFSWNAVAYFDGTEKENNWHETKTLYHARISSCGCDLGWSGEPVCKCLYNSAKLT